MTDVQSPSNPSQAPHQDRSPEQSPDQPASAPEAVSVDIYDQIYHLRGSDPGYITRLAQTVDAKMRAVSAHGGPVDSLRVAVLAALNIADELATLRQRHDAIASSLRQSQHTVRARAGNLSHLLDEALEFDDRRAG